MKRLNVKFEKSDEESLYLRFKAACAIRNIEMSEQVRTWVKDFVEKCEKEAKKKK
jgi:hypothetical protein